MTAADGRGRTAPDGPLVNPAESPLAWLRSRRDKTGEALIDEVAFLAGERLREDYTIAGLMARTTMNWDALGGPAERRTGGGGGGLLVTEAALAARARVDGALRAVGPDLASVLVDVCCHLKGLAEVERGHGWPLRSGKVVLRLGLSALARHYGFTAEARGPAATAIRRWGTPDSRPKA